MGHVLLKLVGDQRQAAGFGAGSVNHPDPVRVGFAIERPCVVINTIRQELKTGPLCWRVTVADCLQISAGGELRGMAGNA